MVDAASPSLLVVGDSFVVQFKVEINPDSGGTATAPLENQVTASGSAVDENGDPINDSGGMQITASDDSDSGTDPSTDNPTDLGDHGTTDDPTPVYLPAIGLAKEAGDAVANGENWDVTFTFVVENTGTVDLNKLNLVDDIATEFGPAFVSASGLTVGNFTGSGSAPGANAAWESDTMLNMVDGTGQLNVGDSFEVEFTITIDPDGIDSVSQALENQGMITGDALDENGDPIVDGSGAPLQTTDDSDNGTDPNGENGEDDGDGTFANDPTPIIIADIGVAKQVVGQPTLLSNGNFEAVYELVIENIGTVDLASLSLAEDIATQFGIQYVDAYDLVVSTAPSANSTVTLDAANWNGGSVTEMVDSATPSLLVVGDSFEIQFKVEIDPDAGGTSSAPLENQVTATGNAVDDNGDPINDSNGDPLTATDLSDSGTDPSTDNPTDLGDHGTTDDPTPVYIPAIGLAKAAGDAVPNGDNWDVTFTFVVENTGTVDLNNLNLIDDIAAEFGPAFVSASGLTVGNFVGSGTAPGANAAWESDTMLNMVDGTGQLNVGDSFEVEFTITIDPDGISSVSGFLENQGTITGDALDEDGNPIDDGSGGTLQATDDSDNGTDPNGENGEDNGDGTFGNDPTPILIADIAVAKEVYGNPVQLANDNWLVTYQLVVENIGSVDLADLSLFDDISAQFGPAYVDAGSLTLVAGPALSGSNVVLDSANWDGGTVTEMVDQSAITSLLVGDSYTVQFTVEIDPDATGSSGPLDNQVTTSGEAVDSMGNPITNSNGDPITITDDSDSGTEPSDTNSGADGDTGGTDDPTPLLLPALSVGKQANTVVIATDGAGNELTGSFDVQYLVTLENTGTIELTNLQLLDDLTTTDTFGDAYDAAPLSGASDRSGLVTGPAILSHTLANPSELPTLNAGFLGGAGQAGLFDGASGALQVGEQIVVSFTIRVDADEMRDGDTLDGMAQNQVQGSADSSEGPVEDESDDGLNPNTNNGDGGTDDPTPFEVPQIRIYKTQGDAVSNANGTSTITVTLRIANTGTVDLGNLSLSEDLETQFGAAYISATTPTISIGTTNPGSYIPAALINGSWNGDTSQDVFAVAETGEMLVAGDDFSIEFDVVVDPDLLDDDSDYLTNTATISGDGTNFDGTVISVDDQSGADDGTGIDVDEPTVAVVPEIGVVKKSGDAVANGDDWDVPFTLVVENTGSVNLNNLTLFDDIASQFGNGYLSVSGLMVQNFVGSGNAPTANGGWMSNTASSLIAGGDLDPGDRFEVMFVVTIDPDGIDSVSQALDNQATVYGDAVDDMGNPLQDISGDQLTADDVSDDGTNPQGNNPGENGDEGTDADPTPIVIADVSVAKEVVGQPALLSNGNFAVTYQLVIENIGTVDLTDMTLVDDIESQFGASVFQGVSGLTLTQLPLDPFSNVVIDAAGWDATAATDILDQSVANSLAIGDQFTIEFVVEVDAVAATGVLENQAGVTGTGVDEDGNPYLNEAGDEITATDDSDSGATTGDTNFGEPGDTGSSDDPTPTYIPNVGLAKDVSATVANGDNWDVTFTLAWENTGTVALTNLQMFDDIASQFGNAFVSASGLAIQNYVGTGTAPVINSGWMADTTQSLLSGGTANVDDTFDVVFTITIDPDGIDSVAQGLENQATTSGEGLDENGNPLLDDSGDPVVANDVSDNGTSATDENGEDNGDGTFGNDPTPIYIADVSLAKAVVGDPTLLSNGNYGVTYQLVVENTGTVDLASLSLLEDLAAQYGGGVVSAGGLAITVPPAGLGSSVTLDSSWDGVGMTEMVDSNIDSLLVIGDSFTLEFDVEVDPRQLVSSPTTNQVSATGQGVDSNGDPINDPNGNPLVAVDDSDSGTNPSTTNNGAPGDSFGSDDPTPLYIPAIGVAKSAGDAVANGDNWDVTFTLVVANYGSVDLTNLTLFDDVASQVGGAFVEVNGLAVQNFNGTGTAPVINSAWATDTTQTMISGGTANVGDTFEIVYTVTIDPDAAGASAPLENQVTVAGEALDENGDPLTDSNGDAVVATDDSDNGSAWADENGEEDTVDGVYANDPTPIVIADLAIAKSIVGEPVLTDLGNYVVTYQLVIENTGTVDLAAVSLLEDLSTQFGSAFVDAGNLVLTSPPRDIGSNVSIDSVNWNGSSAIEMMDAAATNVLVTGDSFTVTFDVEVNPAGVTAPLENQVEGQGDAVDSDGNPINDSSGNPLIATDVSDSGTDPGTSNPDGTGDQGTPDDPTPFVPPTVPLGEISGTVFQDDSNDGLQQPGEAGIEGVEITLAGTDYLGNTVSQTVLTDANGRYTFDGLPAGDYTVTQTQPNDYTDGIDRAGNGLVTPVNDVWSDISLGFGQTIDTGLFGERLPGASGNPPRLPGLPPISSSPISNLLGSYIGAPGPIYSGVPINQNANPLTLDSGRPVTGGYSSANGFVDCACECECDCNPEPVDCCGESIIEMPVQQVVEEVYVDETASCEDGCPPVDECQLVDENQVIDDECSPTIFPHCGEDVMRPTFLQRFSNWFNR